jgi:hypothetical protein
MLSSMSVLMRFQSEEIDAGAQEVREQLREWLSDILGGLGDIPISRWIRLAVVAAIGLSFSGWQFQGWRRRRSK